MQRPTKQIGVGDVTISPLAKQYVKEVLDSERITYGKFTAAFEKAVAKVHRVKYAIFTNSGTSALQVALHALKRRHKWQDGDEVIVPALTFVATVNVVLQNRLTPVFVDVDPTYFEIQPDLVKAKITSKTKAIIPVHVGGLPADMEYIMRLAKTYKLKVLEDSCETMFATYHGKPVGSFGDLACFSTYAAHTLITGVGGFVVTNDRRLAVLVKSLINHGRDDIYVAIDDDQGKSKKDLFRIVSRRFRFIDVGYSYRATEFESALGLAQMRKWREQIKARQKSAKYLSHGLADLSDYLQLPQIRPNSEHIFMFYPLVIRDQRINRSELTFFLEENLIETRFLLPLLNQPVYKRMFGKIEHNYPIARHIGRNGFYIGCHPSLTQKDLDFIIFAFHEFFKKKGLYKSA